MVKAGCAELLAKNNTKYLIYWKKPSEWANIIYSFMDETGQMGSITTAYDLFHGDDTKGRPFYELPSVFWPRVFAVLEKDKKVALFGLTESGASEAIGPETGLKFFA
jgi:ESCRT-II complex subunit VPS25